MSEQIYAGFAKVDITPQLDDPPTFEIYDPIFFRALHIRQGQRQVTFLAADLFALDEGLLQQVADRLMGTDIDPEWVLGGACHLGTGPTLFQHYVNQPAAALKEFNNDERYAEAAAEAVRLARADAAPARIAVGSADAESGLQYNRRAPDAEGRLRMVSLTEFPRPPEDLRYDAVHRQVGVLRCEREARTPIALVNFGCHALSLWDQRGNISGDYPGRMAAILKEQGVDALFFEGALGNVHPVREGADPCERIARSLAGTVLRVYGALEPVGDVELVLGTGTIAVALHETMEVAEARRVWEAQPPEKEGLQRYQYWLAEHCQDRPDYRFGFHVVAIGESALLHLPGEPFVETARAIAAAVPFERVLFLANPCPEAGYLPTVAAHAEGGDEPLFAALHEGAEVEIRAAAIEGLQQVAQ